ncbi:hypothetical protein [Gandjariella thermophila]|nr:hypothetical protein [Gandjariella thermophila]
MPAGLGTATMVSRSANPVIEKQLVGSFDFPVNPRALYRQNDEPDTDDHRLTVPERAVCPAESRAATLG